MNGPSRSLILIQSLLESKNTWSGKISHECCKSVSQEKLCWMDHLENWSYREFVSRVEISYQGKILEWSLRTLMESRSRTDLRYHWSNQNPSRIIEITEPIEILKKTSISRILLQFGTDLRSSRILDGFSKSMILARSWTELRNQQSSPENQRTAEIMNLTKILEIPLKLLILTNYLTDHLDQWSSANLRQVFGIRDPNKI